MACLKKEFTLTLKELSYIILLLVIVISGIFFSVHSAVKYIEKNTEVVSSLIGAGGNLLGGLLGGIVAYIVASYQVNNKLKTDDAKLATSVSSLLQLIKAELNHNKKIINGCKDDFSKGEHLELLNSLTTDAWVRCSDRLGEKVDIETIEELISCTIRINAYKASVNSILLTNSEVLIESIDKTISLIDKDIQSLSNIISK